MDKPQNINHYSIMSQNDFMQNQRCAFFENKIFGGNREIPEEMEIYCVYRDEPKEILENRDKLAIFVSFS